MLCPVVTGGVYLERRQLPPEWKWRKLPESAWDLHAVPELLSSVGLVIWVIAPHNDGDAERDGRENAAYPWSPDMLKHGPRSNYAC